MDEFKTEYKQPTCYTKTDSYNDSYKPICYKDRLAILLGKSDPELPNFVATVMHFVEEDNMLKPCIELVFDRTQITDCYCPQVSDAVFLTVHCSDEGKCIYPVTPANMSSMCLACKAESMAEFLRNEEV